MTAHLCDGGLLHDLAATSGKRIVFYCAFGERSAMAVQAAQDAGLKTACLGRRTADALTAAALSAAAMCGLSTLSAAVRYADTASATSSLADTASSHHRQ